MNTWIRSYNKKTSKYGLRTCIAVALLLAALLLINLLVSLLPEHFTAADISVDRRYSVTDSTKRALSKVQDEVNIYLLANGGEDALSTQSLHLSMFLERMVEYGKKISYSVIDTATETDLVASLNATSASNFSVAVQSDNRTRIIPLNSFFYLYIDGIGKVSTQEAELYYMYSGGQLEVKYAFEAENLLLNAISYVTATSLPKIYVLDGHGETAMAEGLLSEFDADNMVTEALTLTVSGVPSDCSLLFINIPTKDLSASEAEMIDTYMQNGGKIFLVTAPGTTEALPNLMSIAASCGLSAKDGLIIDTKENYYSQYPYNLVPRIGEHDAIADYTQSTRALLPFAHSILYGENAGRSITSLFMTSAEAYYIPLDAQTMERPEGQDAKIQNIGVLSEGKNGTIMWISSPYMTDASTNSSSYNGNFTYVTAITSYLCDAMETTDGDVLFLSGEVLTVPPASTAIISAVMILLIPIAIIGFGFVYWLRRRKK